MNKEWQEFLGAQPAVADAPANRRANATDRGLLVNRVAALSSMGVVTVTGVDAGEFLQAHFTNDVMAVDDDVAQLSGYCSPKGRLLALFYLLKKSDTWFIVLPRDVIEPVLKRLGMFALMARPTGKQTIGKVTRTDVKLTDSSDEIMAIGLVGDQPDDVFLTTLGTAVSSTLNADSAAGTVVHAGGVSILRVPSANPHEGKRWICIGAPSALQGVWEAITPIATRITEDGWLLEDIRAGMPAVVLATQDLLVPQMANLHLLDGVSFTKGCYPGQEIVARMQYLGKLKRRTERFGYHGATVPPGTEVLADGIAGAGLVVSAAPVSGDKSEALIMIKISALDQMLTLASKEEGGKDGPVLHRLPLPYAVVSEDA